MAKPLVSVLIPIYNVEKYIERCARSIFEQTYENLEIVFIDDCTPDNSVEIIEKVLTEYPNRLPQTRIVNHDKNQGLAAARLTGLRSATGKYVQNIDSDDWIDVNMISEMVALAETEEADITICDFMYVYRNHQTQKHVNPPLEPKACLEAVLIGKVHSSVANKLIRRDLYLANDIHPIPGLDFLEDLSVMYKLLYFSKKLSYIPKPYYYYNQMNELSYTSSYSEINVNCALRLIDDMEKFTKGLNICASNEPLNNVLRYKWISFFEAYLLLSKEITRGKEFEQRLDSVGLKMYFSNPMLPIYYKLCGIFYKLKMTFAILFIKRIYWLFKKNGKYSRR